MTFGFVVINDNGQVLVSSETRNLHFVGKADLYEVVRQFDGYGGLRHWSFRIQCNTTPVPFFTMPTEDFYAVTGVSNIGGGMWDIRVIRSGTSASVPEVFVFADPRGFTNDPDSAWGMQVFRDDGTAAFDSRRQPLAITGGGVVKPPNNPLSVPPSLVTAKYCNGTDLSSGGGGGGGGGNEEVETALQ
jgi:hypothetical protein